MATSVDQTPTSVVLRQPIHSLLKPAPNGTPFRTPDRRRFGPLGSSRRTPLTRPHPGGIRETPAMARKRRSSTVVDAEEAERAEHNLKELTKKTWRVFRVTPLYNFHKKKSDLQRYSRSLSACIAAEIKKGVFVDTSIPDDAVVGNFTGPDIGCEDQSAILVEIRGKTRKNVTPLPVICQAVLFSTDLEYNPIEDSMTDSFSYYSTLLVNGPDVLSKTIQGWLEEQFDCRVIPQTFTSHELGFMCSMFTGFGENHKPLELVYGVPAEVEGLDKINFATRADDCVRLWNSVKSPDDESFTTEEANQFIAGLESHFYEIFSIKLNTMPLISIETSVALVSRDGKIKLHSRSTENVLKVCRHLTDLALDKLIVY